MNKTEYFKAVICGNNILYVLYNLKMSTQIKIPQKSGITEGKLSYIRSYWYRHFFRGGFDCSGGYHRVAENHNC
jgi:hypothetical protein